MTLSLARQPLRQGYGCVAVGPPAGRGPPAFLRSMRVHVAHGGEVEQWGERFAHHGVAVEEEEGAVDQAAELGFDVPVAVGGRAVGCGEAAQVVGFMEQLAAAGLQGLVGLLVAGDGDAGAGVGEPQGGERHAGHRLVEITAAGGEAVNHVKGRAHPGGLDRTGQKMERIQTRVSCVTLSKMAHGFLNQRSVVLCMSKAKASEYFPDWSNFV
jgi:hypothetical protein